MFELLKYGVSAVPWLAEIYNVRFYGSTRHYALQSANLLIPSSFRIEVGEISHLQAFVFSCLL